MTILSQLFPLIAQDKANHEVYGARIGAVCSMVALVIFQFLPDAYVPVWHIQAAIMGTVSTVSAAIAGKLKEVLDKRANALAVSRGETPPHSVENADILATAEGGLVVGFPFLAVAVFSWLL